MNRYSVINEKNPREIVLLLGRGCFWQKCSFCDYHLDKQPDSIQAFAVNRQILAQVSGQYAALEVINSGSVFELDQSTINSILQTCIDKQIKRIHFEAHYHYHKRIAAFKKRFTVHGIDVKFKIGVESFDIELREKILVKGMGQVPAARIAEYFDECCLLVGFAGQNITAIRQDIQTALAHFQRVCINVFQPCSAPLPADTVLTQAFYRDIYPTLLGDPRIDILLNNTDFGVGEVTTN